MRTQETQGVGGLVSELVNCMHAMLLPPTKLTYTVETGQCLRLEGLPGPRGQHTAIEVPRWLPGNSPSWKYLKWSHNDVNEDQETET